MNGFLFKKETYDIIGMCIEIHRLLGYGFSEVVYKDVMMLEVGWLNIPAEREKKFVIQYKGIDLQHHYFADFIFFDNIIVEVKAIDSGIDKVSIAQTLNYLNASGCRIGLIINFGRRSLEYKRLVL